MKKVEMDLNRETAMRLWSKQFGKATDGKDFSGREIRKGAYNDRNSEYGWNVDHILPQSKGGKTADHNLIICHISTNDEKADRFPCFKANGIPFQIVKVENHYEIRRQIKHTEAAGAASAEVNFMDSASGLRLFKKLKGMQNKQRFVGTVTVKLTEISTYAVVDFIERLFEQENISFEKKRDYAADWLNTSTYTNIVVKNYNMPRKDDISELLDKCVTLNTYLGYYFLPMGYIREYHILFSVDCYSENSEMYAAHISPELTPRYVLNNSQLNNPSTKNSLWLNELAIVNSKAADELESYNKYGFTEYDYHYTKLAENLEKEVSRN